VTDEVLHRLAFFKIDIFNTATNNNNYIKTLFKEEAYLTIILDML